MIRNVKKFPCEA